MVDSQIRMPCFDVADFQGDTQLPPSARIRWQCPLDIPMLIYRFFEFYGTQYCYMDGTPRGYYWGYEVVSVRTGRRLYTDDRKYSQLNANQTPSPHMPHIEDPFLLGRNLNCVLGWDQNTMLRTKLTLATQQIGSGQAPYGLYLGLQWCQQEITGPSWNKEVAQKDSISSTKKPSISGDNPQSGPATRQQLPGSRQSGSRDASNVSQIRPGSDRQEAQSTSVTTSGVAPADSVGKKKKQSQAQQPQPSRMTDNSTSHQPPPPGEVPMTFLRQANAMSWTL